MAEDIKDTDTNITEDVNHDTSVDDTSVEDTSVDNTSVDDTGSSEQEVAEVSKLSRREVKEEAKKENLQALRASRAQLQRERDEYLQRIQALEAVQAQKAKEAEKQDSNLYEDDFVDNARVDNTRVDDSTKQELHQMKQYIAEMAVSNSRMKLQSQFPDFSKIVNDESIAILKQRFPEIAATLDQSKDIYTTGVSAYNIIKKFDLHLEEDYTEQKRKVEDNINKPRPVSSMKSTSPLSFATDYSDLDNKEVRDEIIRIASERARNG